MGFYGENAQMLFGDAKSSVDAVGTFVSEKVKDTIGARSPTDTHNSIGPEPESEEEVSEFVNPAAEIVPLPNANKTLGIIVEAFQQGEQMANTSSSSTSRGDGSPTRNAADAAA